MVSARTNSCLDSDRAGRSFTAMDAKIATEEGTFTAENAESAENICAIGIRARNKKIQWLFCAVALQYRRDLQELTARWAQE